MLDRFWSWLRNQAKEAVLAGVHDAQHELTDDDDKRTAVEALRQRFKLAEEAQAQSEAANGSAATRTTRRRS